MVVGHDRGHAASSRDTDQEAFGAVSVDSRYEGFKFTLTDVVADNVSAGGFYLGPVTRRPSELEDLGLIGCVVRVAGEVVMTAAGAAVMGHPAASVAWLERDWLNAARLRSGRGRHCRLLWTTPEGLRAGRLVFSGGVTAPVPVVAGGSVTFQLVAWGRSKWPAPDVWEERQSRYRLSFGTGGVIQAG